MVHSSREVTAVNRRLNPAIRRSASLSWADRAQAAVDAAPLPAPVVYLLLGVLAVFLFALNDWLTLRRPDEALAPFHLVLAVEPVYALALMHLLNVQARRALAGMRPLLKPPDAYEELRGRLTTMPARHAWLAGMVGFLVGLAVVVASRIALPAAFQQYLSKGAARPFVEAWLVMSWFIIAGLLLHTQRQLAEINRIYTHHTVIDLDNYQPLFQFSVVSGTTAVGLLVIPYAWNAAVPNLLRETVGALFGALFLAFGVIAFLWPLVGVRNHIAAAKGRALEENARVLKETRERLYAGATRGELAGAGEFGDALAAIRADREALLAIPTWPWAPGTIRSVVAALALPVAIWLIQTVLERFVGR